MFIAQLEQMQRYGMPGEDIAAARAFARSILTLDRAIFPAMPCELVMERAGGRLYAQYYQVPAIGESYIIFVQSLAERLRLQATVLAAQHAHRTQVDENTAVRLVVDSIALHEVRHRLQHFMGLALHLWCLDDLDESDEAIVQKTIEKMPWLARTEHELDARIVQFLYVRDRLAGTDDPVTAVQREPNR